MAKLTLERTLDTSFRDICNPDKEDSRKALLDYNRRVRLLGNTGRLPIEAFQELIDPFRDKSRIIEEAGRKALGEVDEAGGRLFQSGFSAIVMARDFIDGVYDNPNPDPTLSSYGPGLMWAALKLGQERYANTVARATSTIQEGYYAVSEALSGEADLSKLPYSQRHHIGGNGLCYSLYPGSDSMRKLETATAHAGVSGILHTPHFVQLAMRNPAVSKIADEARFTGALDGFEGNLFSGSLDSSLAGTILLSIYDNAPEYTFANWAIEDIVNRHAAGINVH